MKNVVILISGRGSNMQSIVRAKIPGARIAAVISNRSDAAGLAFARDHGIDTAVLDHKEYDGREAFDAALAARIDQFAPDLVVLAGFMRILSDSFVRHYEGRMINIHPSLLPAFTGLHTHIRALEAGVKVHGATVHFVTPTLDAGPIIAQAVVPVHDNDSAETLAARVLSQEHILYPQVVDWFAQDRITLADGRVKIAGVASGLDGWSVPPAEPRG